MAVFENGEFKIETEAGTIVYNPDDKEIKLEGPEGGKVSESVTLKEGMQSLRFDRSIGLCTSSRTKPQAR